MATNQHILAVSLAHRILEEGSVERRRAEKYAEAVGQLTMLILTRKRPVVATPVQVGKLTLIPVIAGEKFSLFHQGYQVGVRYLADHPSPHWQVSSQDAFETGLLAYLLAWRSHALFHIQIHGDPFGNPYWRKESFLNPLRLLLGKWLLSKACKVRVASMRAAESLSPAILPEKQIAVLPIQPQLKAFLAVGEDRALGTSDTFTFIYVGRLAPEKNLTRLIKVFADAVAKNPQLRLRLLGSGPLQATLKKQVDAWALTEVVTFTKWSEDVPQALAEADALVLASKHEGYALVLLEAMAAGLPVVTTDVGCVGEVVQNGVHGIVVSQTDDGDFLQALTTIASDRPLAQRLGRAGHHTAQTLTSGEEEYVKAWTESFCTD